MLREKWEGSSDLVRGEATPPLLWLIKMSKSSGGYTYAETSVLLLHFKVRTCCTATFSTSAHFSHVLSFNRK